MKQRGLRCRRSVYQVAPPILLPTSSSLSNGLKTLLVGPMMADVACKTVLRLALSSSLTLPHVIRACIPAATSDETNHLLMIRMVFPLRLLLMRSIELGKKPGKVQLTTVPAHICCPGHSDWRSGVLVQSFTFES